MPEISQICQKEIVEERRFIEYNISGSYKILQIILTSWVYYCLTYEIGGGLYMITAELTRKINLLPEESYSKVESFVEQLIDANSLKDSAFKVFMEKMCAAEKSVQEHGVYSEEEVEKALAEI